MFARVVYYIRSESLGRFVGQFMGFAFFESYKKDGLLFEDAEPTQFETEEEAQEYLDSWECGKGDCFVEEGIG